MELMEFDENHLRDSLATLPHEKRLAFGLSCAERLYPNYLAFTSEMKWGNASILRSALDLAWRVLEGQQPSMSEVERLQDAVMTVAPDMDDFGTLLASEALDAATACASLMDAIKTNEVAPVTDIASVSHDTVEMYTRDDDCPRDARSSAHPLVQAELRRQHDDLRVLEELPWTLADIVRLRESWRQPPASSIGLPNPEHAGSA